MREKGEEQQRSENVSAILQYFIILSSVKMFKALLPNILQLCTSCACDHLHNDIHITANSILYYFDCWSQLKYFYFCSFLKLDSFNSILLSLVNVHSHLEIKVSGYTCMFSPHLFLLRETSLMRSCLLL